MRRTLLVVMLVIGAAVYTYWEPLRDVFDFGSIPQEWQVIPRGPDSAPLRKADFTIGAPFDETLMLFGAQSTISPLDYLSAYLAGISIPTARQLARSISISRGVARVARKRPSRA